MCGKCGAGCLGMLTGTSALVAQYVIEQRRMRHAAHPQAIMQAAAHAPQMQHVQQLPAFDQAHADIPEQSATSRARAVLNQNPRARAIVIDQLRKEHGGHPGTLRNIFTCEGAHDATRLFDALAQGTGYAGAYRRYDLLWDDEINDRLVGDMLAPPTLFKLAVKAHDTIPKVDAALAKSRGIEPVVEALIQRRKDLQLGL